MTPTLAAIFVYIALQLVIAWAVSRRVAGEDDYLVAGRSLGYVLCSFTIFATWFGAETCIAAPAAAYVEGFAGNTGDPFGYAVCLLATGAFFAEALWERRLTTFGDLFRQRYGAATERLFALIVIPTSLLWAAAQIRGFGQVLSANSEFDVLITTTFAAAVVIAYTTVGGLKADAVTDLIQGLTLTLGVGALFVSVFLGPQGFDFAAIPMERVSLVSPERPWPATLEAWAVPVLGSLFTAEVVARVAAARSARVAKRGALAGGVAFLGVGVLAASVGLAGAVEIPGLAEPEQVVIAMAERHLGGVWSVVFSGALAAAILSTVDSCLLTAGSMLAHNLIIPLRPGMSEAQKLRLNRAAVVLFGVVAYGMAVSAEAVYLLVEEASAFGGAADWQYPFLASGVASLAAYVVPAGWGNGGAAGRPTGGGDD
jgi:Na+/proline symporter